MAGGYHLARHYHVSPDAVTQAQLRAFYPWILNRDLAVLREALPRMIRQIHRPRVYSPQEIERLLTVVLHTWVQKLIDHYHLHVLVTGGALAPDGIRWVPTTDFYLFRVRALGRVFRAKLGEGLQRLFAAGQLRFHAQLEPLAVEARFQALIRQATRHPWNVYAKHPLHRRTPPTVLPARRRRSHDPWHPGYFPIVR